MHSFTTQPFNARPRMHYADATFLVKNDPGVDWNCAVKMIGSAM